MIKNLIYGALAAGAVVTVTVTAIIELSDKTKQSHEIRFDANGGVFSAKNTCWTNEVNLADCMSNVLNDVEGYLTYPNHDLLGWTVTSNGTDFVDGRASVANYTNKTLYAKWGVEYHSVSNGSYVTDTDVKQFPVVFYGNAEWDYEEEKYPTHKISFCVPTEGDFRLSLDPQQIGGARPYDVKLFISKDDSIIATNKFGYSSTYPIDFIAISNQFERNKKYTFELDFGAVKKTENIQYAFGIGLDGVQVRFDPTEGYLEKAGTNSFYKNGFNCTIGYAAYGYMPTPKPKDSIKSVATFDGWYTSEMGRGVNLKDVSIVVTNETLYAYWKYSSSAKYYVAFDGAGGKGTMQSQTMHFTQPEALCRNRYYKRGFKFVCWTNDSGTASFDNGQVVTNLCTRPEEIYRLHAKWQESGDANYFVVSPVTNFTIDAVSNDVEQTYFDCLGASMFCLDVTNMTNSVDCRVAIDPADQNYLRTNAMLCVEKAVSSNGWVCVTNVTDLSLREVRCAFTNGIYRFAVNNVPANYAYVVSLGEKGYQIDFDSCGTKVASYNWTTNSPYGYELQMADRADYGSFLGWYTSNDIAKTNKYDKSELVVSNATFYAHWSNQPYYIEFDGKSATNPTNSYVQEFRYGISTTLTPNLYYKEYHCFLGWDTNSIAKNVVYEDGATVSNLCTIAGETNKLYAVWKETPGENHYVLSQGVTNFQNVAVSTNAETFFHCSRTATVQEFQMTLTNRSETTVRVSLDPDLYGVTTNTAVQTNAMLRTGATLDVYRWDEGATNWAKKACCHVSDLQAEEQLYGFTNATYRFVVTATYPYVVGLGLKGEQVNFDPCDGSVDKTKSKSTSLTFNWTVDTPYGYLPTLTAAHKDYGNFVGWFDSPDRTTSNQVFEVSIVSSALQGTNTVYARWQNVPDCWIAFSPSSISYSGTMEPQGFFFKATSKTPLNKNQYSVEGHIFKGWDTSPAATTVLYADCQSVYASNIVEKVGTTNYLYAVWEAGYEYEIDEDGKDFGEITLSPTVPTYISGSGEATSCTFTVSEKATNCRVAVDPADGYGNPEDGYGRRNVTLSILYAPKPEESEDGEEEEEEEEPVWSATNLCVVSDLSDHEVWYTFSTAYRYKFALSNVPEDYGYVVSVGAEGAQYTFETCGGEIDEDEAMSTLLTFNWTVGSPLGYLHPMKDSEYLGTCLGWSYSPNVRDEEEDLDEEADEEDASDDDEEEEEEEEKEIEDEASCEDIVATTNTTLYAWWSDAQVIAFTFDWNLPDENGSETNLTTKYYGEFTPICLYAPNQTKGVPTPTCKGWGFLGWTTDAEGTEGWEISSFTVSTNSPNYFYAQWTHEWKTERLTNGVAIVGKNGMIGGEMVIPDTIKPCPLPVVSVGDGAFSNRTDLTKLIISTNVTYVGNSAFKDCRSLAEVEFPSKVIKDEYAKGGYLAKIVGESEDDPIELGTNVFCGCTVLTSAQLPLGLMIIPDECFSGCTALREFSMPYTVIQIGKRAFYRCTHLQTMEVTEVVDELQTGAFCKCARLKIARFIGDKPDSVASDIFNGTQRTALAAYFENMSVAATSYCGGNWPNLPATWPDGNYARSLTWIAGGLYSRCKVSFNMNNEATPATSSVTPVLYIRGRDFGLLAPTKDDLSKSNFSGWWTQPVGGRRIGNYRKVTENMTVYAHWDGNEGNDEIGSRSGEDYPVSWPGTAEDLSKFSGFYSEEDDMFYYSASTFNGIVIDMTSVKNGTNTMAGTILFTFAEGSSSSDGMQSPFSAVITWNDGSLLEIMGYANAEGCLVSSNGQWSFGEGENACTITKSGIYGNLYDNVSGTTYRIYAARNRYSMSTDASRDIVLTALQATRGTWHVVLRSEACASKFSNGYTTLAVTIAGMGEATIMGTTADGTWLSATSKLVIGDGCCCLPVSLQYPGGGGFAFILWFTWQSDGSFDESDASVQGLTQWTTPTFKTDFVDVMPLTFIDEKLYEGEADVVACDELGTNVLATIMMEGAAWTVQSNNYWLELSYDSQTGMFSGSFQATTEGGKTAQATVRGVFTDRITTEDSTVTEFYWGYGTAVISGVGSVPVEIMTE